MDGTGIRTPDQRLRVFVSSTLAELADERAAVSEAISAVGLTPVLFELGARPHPPQELYRAYLAQSDIFVGLYWQRYGWIGPGMDISGLEDELQRSTSLPRLMYVKTPAPDREPQLAELIARIEAEGTDAYRPFRTPEELGRLVHDDLALLLSERFAATAGAATVPARTPARSLPVTSTSLIGRDDDIAEVVALLETPGTRLVTLSGPGGIGKTRLAIAVAERFDDRVPRGAVFLPVASITEPELVMPRIAAAVGAIVEGARSPLDVVADHLDDTPTLLVLDNLEQVVEVAPALDELLSRCPNLQILATSRAVLRIRAEREYPVRPLATRTDSAAAVQLFVDRARAVRFDFALTEDNTAAIVDICRRLDGLPLAIELAAARIRLLDPAALLARLAGNLDALGAGPVDLPERQRTLRATVEWSIELLDAAQAQALADLSVFVGGWTVDAAAHVADVTEDHALDLLDALAGNSLVEVEVGTAEPRFRMLESVRELAAEQLGAGERGAEVERRHASHYAALVADNDWPMEGQAAWADRLLVEEGNVRAAIRWLFVHDVTPLPHLFRVLWLFWQMRDRMPEGQAWVEELRSAADPLDEQARAELLLISAVTAVEVGDDDRAFSTVDELWALRRTTDDAYLESAAALALSWILPLADDMEGALEAATAAVDGFRRQNQPFLAFAALTVGMVQMVLGRDEEARVALDEVLLLGERMDNSWLTAAARGQLASLAVRTGHPDQAWDLLVSATSSAGDTEESTLTMTVALVARAQLALAQGDPTTAATALGAADGLRRRKGLQAWPSTRRGEADLTERVAGELGPDAFRTAFEAGSRLAPADLLQPPP